MVEGTILFKITGFGETTIESFKNSTFGFMNIMSKIINNI
jgi:hypothetical protein